MRRVAIVLVLVTTMMSSTLPAFASDELAPFFEEHGSAEFSGEESVVCHTPDGIVSELTFVRQADGIRVVEDAEGAVGVARVSVGEGWVLGSSTPWKWRAETAF